MRDSRRSCSSQCALFFWPACQFSCGHVRNQLCARGRYGRTLFSEASRSIVRDALDNETEERVNASIGSLLQLLSQYLLLRPAHKTLEYLIRVYRVNEFNKDELLHAAMPYHATRTFGQLVKLCLGRYSAGMARAA
eukprot:COSAG02_NODE_32249_length_519_cov_1.004762_1_plen_135_part_01